MRGNHIRFRCFVKDTTPTGLTVPFNQGTYLSSGATDDNNTLALAAVASQRYHLIACPWDSSDPTNIGRVVAFMGSQADPLTGRRGRMVCGTQASLGTATTFAQGLNAERAQVLWHFNAQNTPAELAASAVGEMAEGLSTDRATNFDGRVLGGIAPQWSKADQPEGTEIVAALNVGLTPVGVEGNNATIIRSITSRSRDALSNPDYRVLDTHYVDVSDYIADILQDGFPDRFSGFKLGTDIAGEMPPPGVATAGTVKSWAIEVIGKQNNILLENFDTNTVPNMVFERNETAKGRVDAVIPIDIIELFHQFAADVRQVN